MWRTIVIGGLIFVISGCAGSTVESDTSSSTSTQPILSETTSANIVSAAACDEARAVWEELQRKFENRILHFNAVVDERLGFWTSMADVGIGPTGNPKGAVQLDGFARSALNLAADASEYAAQAPGETPQIFLDIADAYEKLADANVTASIAFDPPDQKMLAEARRDALSADVAYSRVDFTCEPML